MDKEKLRAEVIEISELEENWDGYGADPIDKAIIDKANLIIDSLNEKYDDPDVAPYNVGVQFEWGHEGNALEVYSEDSGVVYLKVLGEDMEDWVETEIEHLSEINELLEWLFGVW